jgi:hypothetical protein
VDYSYIGPDQHPFHSSEINWDVGENTDSTFGIG